MATAKTSMPDPAGTTSPPSGTPVQDGTVLPEEEEILVTREGLQKLKEELRYLKEVRRKEIAERLKEAISYGDLSENAEYEEAKNEQAFVEGRVIELERKIRNAQIISEKTERGGAQIIEIGTRVTVREKSGRGEAESYTIVGSTEADPLEQKISNESPIGRALLGHVRGEIVEVEAPGGRTRYEILKVA
jgi:transcription elongation factor GreA